MNKLLYTIKNVLYIITLVLSYLTIKKTSIGLIEPIYILILIISTIIIIKNLIKKEEINRNKIYNILSIFVFLIIIFILTRFLCGTSFIHNDKKILSELNHYTSLIYNKNYQINTNSPFEQESRLYSTTNMIYFNIMFILLFIYRKLNVKK